MHEKKQTQFPGPTKKEETTGEFSEPDPVPQEGRTERRKEWWKGGRKRDR
jgi:hypothetical protein